MLGKPRKPDPGDPGHIVPTTKGTSNEISFSVLHQMRNAAAQEGAPGRPAWEFPQEEVKQRRRARRRGKRLAALGIGLGVLALAVAMGALVVVNVQHQMDHVARMKGMLGQVSARCDELAGFNEAVAAALVQQMGTVPYDQMKAAYDAAEPGLPAKAEELRQLKGQLEAVQENLKVPADREAANQGIAAVNAQLNLIDMGQQAMAWALPAQDAYGQAKAAMDHIMAANDLASRATEQIATLNAESAQASQQTSQQALAELASARDGLQAAADQLATLAQREGAGDATVAATATIAQYLDYTQLRIDAQQAAVQSMQAYLDRDKGTLAQANDRYNQLEQRAVELIAAQSVTPADAFATAFTAVRTPASDQWAAESARAAVAASAVRDYLS